MEEAAPDTGTSRLSTADAVDVLLSATAPETEKADAGEENQTQEQLVENEPIVEEESDAEADEVEVETVDADDEAEEIDDDESEADVEEETEDVVQDDAEQTYAVRVGEEEFDVPLSELTNSYMRQSDYTRKTQQVAEARKTAEAELEAVQGERLRYADQLNALGQALSQQEPTQEFWDELYTSDPLEYTRQRDLARDRKEAVEQVQAEQVRVQQEQMAQTQVAAQKRLAEEQERLTELIPEWIDQTLAQTEKSAVVTYAQRHGYTPDELQNVSDSRAVMMIRKAMLYDELMDGKPAAQKKTRKAPKMTKSGQPKSNRQSNQRRKQKALANVSNKKGRAAMDAAVDFLLT